MRCLPIMIAALLLAGCASDADEAPAVEDPAVGPVGTVPAEARRDEAAPPPEVVRVPARPSSPSQRRATTRPTLDLTPDTLALGMPARSARPPLTAGCLRDHYAERLGERFLRLSCLTAEAPFEQRLRLAFLEYADDAPARLAYHIVETRVSGDALASLWAHLREEAEALHGPPDLADTAAHLAWSGVGRDGQPTSLELTVEADPRAPGWHVVQQAYRHRTLVGQLGLPR